MSWFDTVFARDRDRGTRILSRSRCWVRECLEKRARRTPKERRHRRWSLLYSHPCFDNDGVSIDIDVKSKPIVQVRDMVS